MILEDIMVVIKQADFHTCSLHPLEVNKVPYEALFMSKAALISARPNAFAHQPTGLH